MAANYKQTDGAFSRWIRSGFVTIANAFGAAPEIVYAEQEVSVFDGGEPIITRKNAIKKSFNPGFMFPVYDSVTGLVKATVSELDFYELAASHYLATAALRDAGDASVVEVMYPRMFPTVALPPVLPPE